MVQIKKSNHSEMIQEASAYLRLKCYTCMVAYETFSMYYTLRQSRWIRFLQHTKHTKKKNKSKLFYTIKIFFDK